MKEILKELQKKYPNSDVVEWNEAPSVEFMSTWIAQLDHDLSWWWIKWRFVEVFWKNGCGKTCLALLTMKSVIESWWTAAFIDCERTFDKRQAMTLWMNLSDVLYIKANSWEDACNMIRDLSKKWIDLIIVDSVAAMVPNHINEKDFWQHPMALQARMLTIMFQWCTNVIADNKTTVLLINQERAQMDPFWSWPKTTWWYALPYYCSQRVWMRKPWRKEMVDWMTLKYTIHKNKAWEIMVQWSADVKWEWWINEDTNNIMKAVAAWIIQSDKWWYEYKWKKYRLNKFTEDIMKEIVADIAVLEEDEISPWNSD